MRRRSITFLLPVLLLLIAAATLPGCANGPLNKADQQAFLTAHQDFERGNYVAAEKQLTNVIRRNPRSEALSELYYFRGLSRLRLDRRSEARDDFRRGASVYGRELTQVYCAVALANLEYEDGNDAAAAGLYAQAIDHPVKDLQIDAILFRLAVCYQRLGRWEEADRRLAKLISDYPDSSLAPLARKRFQATAFTIQAGAFADRSNAESLAARVRSEGYPVTLAVTDSGGKVLHAVTVGRFRTWKEANAAATRLRAKGYAALIKP